MYDMMSFTFVIVGGHVGVLSLICFAIKAFCIPLALIDREVSNLSPTPSLTQAKLA